MTLVIVTERFFARKRKMSYIMYSSFYTDLIGDNFIRLRIRYLTSILKRAFQDLHS